MANSPNSPRGGLSVGGPGGIRIDGSNVHLSGAPMVGHAQLQPPAPAPISSTDLSAVGALMIRYSGVAGAVLGIGGAVLLVSASLVIWVLQLPLLPLAAVGAVGVVFLTAGVGVTARARKNRVTTGGIEPEVERRILDVAVACKGRVTVTAVARALAMPMAEADATLTALATTGYVTVDNDPASGVIVYVFPDIEAGLVPTRRLS